MSIPKRILGSTGQEVTILGLGGEGMLRTHGYEREAYGLMHDMPFRLPIVRELMPKLGAVHAKPANAI